MTDTPISLIPLPPTPTPKPVYPPELPDDLIEFLHAYDTAEGTDGESEVRDLARILALDLHYMAHGTKSDRDPVLHEIRIRQAEYLQGHIQRISNVLLYNMLYLGRLLIEASERALYTYLGYPSLQSWCETLHVERSTLKKAKQLADLWPWLRQFGYSIYDVVDGTITEEKVRILQRLATEKKQERGIQAIAVYSEHYGSPIKEEEGQGQETRKLSRAVQKAIDLLPNAQQEVIAQEVQQRYIAHMRGAIDHIRELPMDALRAEQDELRGLTSKPYILIECIRRGKKMEYRAGSFACGTAEILSFISNQVIYQYKIDGHLFTASQFGEYLNEHELPDWQDDD